MPPLPLFPPVEPEGGEGVEGVEGVVTGVVDPELPGLVLAVLVFAEGEDLGAAEEDEVGFTVDEGATLEGRVLQRFWFWLRLDLASSA